MIISGIATSYYASRNVVPAKHFTVRITRYPCRFKKTDAAAPLLYPSQQVWDEPDMQRKMRLFSDQLYKTGVEAIRAQLDDCVKRANGRTVVLLCFESLKEPGEQCHRRWFAEWWKEHTGEAIEELQPAQAQRSLL